ncbi:MAG: hypothetical protein HY094_07135 [Candidatus Melainabacteria bacterium]|nr:hypothetical protein [Candidatus Melainabacteria bacterium]
MIFTQVENIHLHTSQALDTGTQMLLEKAFSPYKTTLRYYARETIKDLTLKYIGGFSTRLLHIILTNPQLLDLIKGHPEILRLLRDDTKVLNFAIKHPDLLVEFLKNPRKFIVGFIDLKKNFKENLKADEKVNLLIKLKNKNLDSLQKLADTTKVEINTIHENRILKINVNKEPHLLDAEIVAKAHIENPNTQGIIGKLKTFSRKNLNNTGLIPYDQELQPGLITTARAFALNPELLAILGATAATTNKTKIKNPAEKEFELETQSELENSRDETIKSITEICKGEPSTKITANLK